MLVVLFLGNPGGSEGAQGAEGGGSLPYGELTVCGCNDLDLSAGWGESNNFVLQSVWESLVHGGTSGQDNVLAKILSDIDIRSLNGLPGELMDGLARETIKGWLEEELWALHSDGSLDFKDFLIWESELLVVLR